MLCLKGFAENAKAMETYSPTASRRSHRKVAVVSVANGWPMECLDIGAAFLKGMTFDELREEGLRRQQAIKEREAEKEEKRKAREVRVGGAG